MATFSMFCYIIYQIYRQSNIDLLFIDWEKPKEYFKGGEIKKGVSIWRTLLCCNEFNELQDSRYVNLEDIYIFVIFLLM